MHKKAGHNPFPKQFVSRLKKLSQDNDKDLMLNYYIPETPDILETFLLYSIGGH